MNEPTNSAEQDLHGFLSQLAKMKDAYKFNLERHLLENARWMPPPPPYKPRPKGIRKQANKMCYRNSLMLAMSRPGWKYVEGYALGIIPTQHAWCVDEEGRVVEPTWKQSGSAYFGIAMEPDDVLKYCGLSGIYGVFGYATRSPEGWSHMLTMTARTHTNNATNDVNKIGVTNNTHKQSDKEN